MVSAALAACSASEANVVRTRDDGGGACRGHRGTAAGGQVRADQLPLCDGDARRWLRRRAPGPVGVQEPDRRSPRFSQRRLVALARRVEQGFEHQVAAGRKRHELPDPVPAEAAVDLDDGRAPRGADELDMRRTAGMADGVEPAHRLRAQLRRCGVVQPGRPEVPDLDEVRQAGGQLLGDRDDLVQAVDRANLYAVLGPDEQFLGEHAPFRGRRHGVRPCGPDIIGSRDGVYTDAARSRRRLYDQREAHGLSELADVGGRPARR